MRLTLWTDYALRTLLYAGLKDGELATIAELAKQSGIPRTHLTKIVHRLGKLGYLETVRGKGGGFRLGQASADINIAAVVRDTEAELSVVACVASRGVCRIERGCLLRHAVKEATQAFLDTLARYTLADLLGPGNALAKGFGLSGRLQAST